MEIVLKSRVNLHIATGVDVTAIVRLKCQHGYICEFRTAFIFVPYCDDFLINFWFKSYTDCYNFCFRFKSEHSSKFWKKRITCFNTPSGVYRYCMSDYQKKFFINGTFE